MPCLPHSLVQEPTLRQPGTLTLSTLLAPSAFSGFLAARVRFRVGDSMWSEEVDVCKVTAATSVSIAERGPNPKVMDLVVSNPRAVANLERVHSTELTVSPRYESPFVLYRAGHATCVAVAVFPTTHCAAML